MKVSAELICVLHNSPTDHIFVPPLHVQVQETPDTHGKLPASPAASEPDFGGADVGSVDFEVDAEQARDVSGLGLSLDQSKDDESTLQRSDIGSLEISGLDDESVPKKRKAKDVGPKRMKKRRKIVIDNNMTELSSDHMKAMLRDTSDIVMQEKNIGDWEEEDGEDFTSARMNRLFESVPIERLLARPCLGDDGGLAQELLALWGRNTVKSKCNCFILPDHTLSCLV